MLSRRTRSENTYLARALFGYCNTQNCWVTLFSSLQIPPDGSEMSSALYGVYHWWWSQIFTFIIVENFSTLGARSALLMGVAPKAIVEFYLFEYRLKVSCTSLQPCSCTKYFYLIFFLSGARLALPMGVATEAIMGCLHPIIGSILDLWLVGLVVFLCS
jgi:hypothetical protein